MQTEELLWFIPSIFIFCNSLLIGLLFLTIQSKNKKGNIYLGLFLLGISINLFNDFINEFDISRFIFEPFLFILPVLFFYLLVTTNNKVREWHYLLFLPGVVHNLFLHFPNVFTENTITIYETTIYLLEIILTVYAFKILQNHYKILSNYYSDFEYKTLNWLKSIFVLNVLINFLNISTFIVDISSFRIIELTIDTIALVLFMFMIYWIAYNGLSQPEIFKKRLFLENDNSNSEELKKSTSETDIQKFKEIKDQIQKRELFINPKLNLTSLSRELNIKEKELSRLINKQGELNFHQFINGYRIQKFKILLESPKSEHLSLFGLAQESGFNSKSSFYQVFKALEGKTPKQYHSEHNKSKRKNSDLF
jgi:AraC-like DNA-binding protein